MRHSIRRRVPGAALLFVLLFAAGCSTGTAPLIDEDAVPPGQAAPVLAEPPTLAIARGEALLVAGDFQAATTKFAKALQQDPENRAARLGLAEAQLGQHRYIEALEGFEAVMDSEALQARALQGRGITLALMGRDELSLPLLREAVSADPGLWRAWNAIGRGHALDGDIDQALASYDRALLANAQAAPVHNNRGLALLGAKRYAEAEDSFRRALALSPGLAAARMNLRLAIAWQGRYEEAISEIPRDSAPRILNNVGFVAMERGDLGKARILFTKAMEISPSYYPTAARNLETLRQREKMAASPDLLG